MYDYQQEKSPIEILRSNINQTLSTMEEGCDAEWMLNHVSEYIVDYVEDLEHKLESSFEKRMNEMEERIFRDLNVSRREL